MNVNLLLLGAVSMISILAHVTPLELPLGLLLFVAGLAAGGLLAFYLLKRGSGRL
jgi:hypothetical protein